MIRAISIILVAAIALQTVGCSTWRPLARANAVAEDDSPLSVRNRVLGRLKEGMAVRIIIREGTDAPIKGQVIECIIKEIGTESLTLFPITDHVRGTVKREFKLRYTDILIIEYREFLRGLTGWVVGLSLGATVVLLALAIMYANAYSE